MPQQVRGDVEPEPPILAVQRQHRSSPPRLVQRGEVRQRRLHDRGRGPPGRLQAEQARLSRAVARDADQGRARRGPRLSQRGLEDFRGRLDDSPVQVERVTAETVPRVVGAAVGHRHITHLALSLLNHSAGRPRRIRGRSPWRWTPLLIAGRKHLFPLTLKHPVQYRCPLSDVGCELILIADGPRAVGGAVGDRRCERQ